MKSILVHLGNFFFRHRNLAFPLMILAVYFLVPPPDKAFGSEVLEEWKDVLALGLVLAGLALRVTVLGFIHVRRGGSGKKVHADVLYRDGMFGVCRNPLYVGNLLIYSGVFAMHGDWRVLLGGVAVFGLIYQSMVYAEEAYLEKRFGEAYAVYKAEVPRWGFHLSRFKASTAHMRFSLKQGLFVDYNPIANAVVMMAATEIYETLYFEGHGQHRLFLVAMAGVIFLAAAWTAIIRFLKKRDVTPRGAGA